MLVWPVAARRFEWWMAPATVVNTQRWGRETLRPDTKARTWEIFRSARQIPKVVMIMGCKYVATLMDIVWRPMMDGPTNLPSSKCGAPEISTVPELQNSFRKEQRRDLTGSHGRSDLLYLLLASNHKYINTFSLLVKMFHPVRFSLTANHCKSLLGDQDPCWRLCSNQVVCNGLSSVPSMSAASIICIGGLDAWIVEGNLFWKHVFADCLPMFRQRSVLIDSFFSEKPKIKWAAANTRRNAKSSHWTDSDSFPSYTTHLNYSTHLNAAAAAAAANGCETKHICETVRDNHMLLKEAADMNIVAVWLRTNVTAKALDHKRPNQPDHGTQYIWIPQVHSQQTLVIVHWDRFATYAH